MKRETDKHSPRVDEEMEQEVGSITKGAPTDSRADEDEVPEPGAEAGGHRTMTGPEGGEELSYEEIEDRKRVAASLEPSVFPATPAELVQSAKQMNAPRNIVQRIESLPEKRYENTEEVWQALSA